LALSPAVRPICALAAEETARDEQGLAVVVQPTSMEQLRAASEAGGLMPQKSTYFYPKLATGLVFNPLYE